MKHMSVKLAVTNLRMLQKLARATIDQRGREEVMAASSEPLFR
jgi:hypothetical protein